MWLSNICHSAQIIGLSTKRANLKENVSILIFIVGIYTDVVS